MICSGSTGKSDKTSFGQNKFDYSKLQFRSRANGKC